MNKFNSGQSRTINVLRDAVTKRQDKLDRIKTILLDLRPILNTPCGCDKCVICATASMIDREFAH